MKKINQKIKKEKVKDIIKDRKSEKEKEKDIIKDEVKDAIEVKIIFSLNNNIKKLKLDDFKILKINKKNEKEKYFEYVVEFLPVHENYSMKTYDINFLEDHKLVLLEKSELDKINYPFLCNLIFYFQTKEKIYFVEPLLREKLFNNYKLLKIDEDKARFYIAQIALTIEYLHSIGRKYNNLEPNDFYLDDKGYIRLTKNEKIELDLDKASISVDNKEYLAPEIISHKESKNADWWSLGFFLFMMLYGRYPFYSSKSILTGKVKFFENIEISEDAKDIILKLLEKDPIKRLGSHNGIEDIKNHPFFKDINFDLILKKQIPPPFIPQLLDESFLNNISGEIYYNKLYLK